MFKMGVSSSHQGSSSSARGNICSQTPGLVAPFASRAKVLPLSPAAKLALWPWTRVSLDPPSGQLPSSTLPTKYPFSTFSNWMQEQTRSVVNKDTALGRQHLTISYHPSEASRWTQSEGSRKTPESANSCFARKACLSCHLKSYTDVTCPGSGASWINHNLVRVVTRPLISTNG